MYIYPAGKGGWSKKSAGSSSSFIRASTDDGGTTSFPSFDLASSDSGLPPSLPGSGLGPRAGENCEIQEVARARGQSRTGKRDVRVRACITSLLPLLRLVVRIPFISATRLPSASATLIPRLRRLIFRCFLERNEIDSHFSEKMVGWKS